MESFAREYPDWKAPSADGEFVIWPAPRELLEQTRENQRRLFATHTVHLHDVPLSRVRRRMRQFVGLDDAQTLVATGHQTELFHPGVWVKNVLINEIAARLDGQAFHIAVDTDASKHLHVRWPKDSFPITDDPRIASAAWSGLLAPPTPAHLGQLLERFDASDWSFRPLLPDVVASLRRLSMEYLDLPAALTNAMHELDWRLGLRHHSLLASPIWNSEPFLLFAHALIANADSFASAYNRALRAYRAEHGVRSHMRPMPDLFVGDETVEIPFWLDDLHAATRTRPSVFRTDRGWILELTSGEEFAFEPGGDGWGAAERLQRWLASNRHRLAPRALTLTTFLRLFMADQFVHGIGGGRYDQVADRIVASYFKMEPPRFSVTTATMYFPEALGRSRACLPCVKQEGHRLRHGLLGERKLQLVHQIDSLPRRSRQRSESYFQMHNQLAAAARKSEELRRWQEKLQQTQEQAKLDQALFDRELFYAIQPEDRLRSLISQYASMLRSAV